MRLVSVIDLGTGQQTTVAEGLSGAGMELASDDASLVAELGYAYTVDADGIGDTTPPPVMQSWQDNHVRQTELPASWAYAADLTIARCAYQ